MQVGDWLKDLAHPLEPGDVVSLNDRDLWYLHLYEKESVYAYPYRRYLLKTRFDPVWYAFQRARAHDVIPRCVRLQNDITERVDTFHEQHMREAALWFNPDLPSIDFSYPPESQPSRFGP